MMGALHATLVSSLPRLRRFGLALTGSACDADELVQEVCERALQRTEQLRDGMRLDAWLYGIMRNRWTDEVRWRRVRRHDDVEAASEIVGEDGERAAEARITLDRVRAGLATLPADQRTVLVLVCVDGLTYKEAAEVLGVPVGTVMSRLARGRKALHVTLTQRKFGTEAALRALSVRQRGPG